MACHHDFYGMKSASAYLTYISSILSILGCILIIVTFILWKDVRQSTARVILLFLALADLGTGLGYLMAVVGFNVMIRNSTLNQHPPHSYIMFGRVQSFITTFFPVSSFFWTTVMALYFLSALVFRRHRWGWKVLVIVNVICWGIPFVLLVAMSGLGILGPSKPTGAAASATWSFVSDNTTHTNTRPAYLGFEALCGKGWEFLSYFIVGGCYLVILINYRCYCKRSSTSSGTGTLRDSTNTVITKAVQNADFKLIMIPVVFFILRMWGSFRYLASTAMNCNAIFNQTDQHYCVSKSCYYTLYHFTYYFQAFCDPAQGFGNAILFVAFSAAIRTRFIRLLYIIAYRVVSLCQRGNSSPSDSLANTPLLGRKANDSASVTYSPFSTRRAPPVDVQYSDHDSVEIRYGTVDPKEKSCHL